MKAYRCLVLSVCTILMGLSATQSNADKYSDLERDFNAIFSPKLGSDVCSISIISTPLQLRLRCGRGAEAGFGIPNAIEFNDLTITVANLMSSAGYSVAGVGTGFDNSQYLQGYLIFRKND